MTVDFFIRSKRSHSYAKWLVISDIIIGYFHSESHTILFGKHFLSSLDIFIRMNVLMQKTEKAKKKKNENIRWKIAIVYSLDVK